MELNDMAKSPAVTPTVEGLRYLLSCLISEHLKCINYTQPPKADQEALRDALLERGRQAAVHVDPHDGSNMRFEAGLAVAEMYPLHPFDIQLHIGLFTWPGFIIDNLNADLGPDLVNFHLRFFRGGSQPCAILHCFATFVNSNAIELRREYQTIVLLKDALSWPYYFRDKEGLPEVYTYFCFYRKACPDISRYMPAAPQMGKFNNLTNDILS